jgi:hypothetical protein
MSKYYKLSSWVVPGSFLVVRVILFASLPIEGLRGYGDFVHFYHLAAMGRPFFDLWLEFPPVFPFLSRLIYLLAAGREHTYDYLLAILLTLAQAGSIYIFIRLLNRIYNQIEIQKRTWMYFALLVGLAYGWWYFDPLAVLLMLLALYWVLQDHDKRAGVAIAFGVLVKLFPALVLAVSWRYKAARKALTTTIIAVGLAAIVYLSLYLASPEMTRASLLSQSSKGSWETLWALIDGNLHTGNFGPEAERYDPATAALPRGNPTRISPWLSLAFFTAFGAWLFWKAKPEDKEKLNDRSAIAFLGLTWCIFLLWSPGYSPQWVLYLLPLVLLALPFRKSVLMAVTLVLVSLLEWPLLLSRGYFEGLWLVVPLRVLLFVLLAIEFWSVVQQKQSEDDLSIFSREAGSTIQ